MRRVEIEEPTTTTAVAIYEPVPAAAPSPAAAPAPEKPKPAEPKPEEPPKPTAEEVTAMVEMEEVKTRMLMDTVTTVTTVTEVEAPPERDEINKTLALLGHSPRSRVGVAVHAFYEHERAVAAGAMTSGLSSVIDDTRKMRKTSPPTRRFKRSVSPPSSPETATASPPSPPSKPPHSLARPNAPGHKAMSAVRAAKPDPEARAKRIAARANGAANGTALL